MQKQPMLWMTLLASAVLAWPAPRVCAQDPTGDPHSKKQDSPEKQPKKKNTDTATQSAPDQPIWDPLRAEKDIQVGQFYMKKGDLDAAIDRFADATTAKPGYALPFRYLAEAQEKKGLKRQAIKSFTRYLDLYPHADDGEKIRKHLEKLWSDVEKEKKSAS
jgi:tetratricopeptide (TPR) repeat protein